MYRKQKVLQAYLHPRVITMLFLGFAAGLPLLLIFSTLSLWLREADVARSTVTYFSWAALGYSFKFLWAPVIDRLPLPFLTATLGRRRAWLLTAQGLVILAIFWMAGTDPATDLTAMALAAVLLGFSSATQDVVIDAYRIESADESLQALMASSYIAGYRIGMLVAGAGALKLAAWLGTSADAYSYEAWKLTYWAMAGVMGIGVLTTLLIREPVRQVRESRYFNRVQDYLRFVALFFLAAGAFVGIFLTTADVVTWLKTNWVPWDGGHQKLAGFVIEALRLFLALFGAWLAARAMVLLGVARKEVFQETYIDPMADFFRRYGKVALLLLLLIGTYRISDIVLGVISNVFYQDMGFNKDQIANVSKTFGLLMTIVGGFLGGGLALRFGVIRILFLGALLSAGTNLLFLLLASDFAELAVLVMLGAFGPSAPEAVAAAFSLIVSGGADVAMLTVVIAADNLSAGLASAAFIAYLSGLTNISFTAFQYAVFSSLMTLAPKLLAGYSGSMVDAVGYNEFFLITAALGLPVLLLVYLAGRYAPVEPPRS